jgi:glycerophosphoryl diester phosphodiesterase
MRLPAIIAHRGYSSLYRENSPAAWIGAIDAKADYIEVDVRVTSDLDIVCVHDANLQRLAGRPDTIAEMSTADLAAIEAEGFPAAPSLGLLFDTVPEEQPILFDVKDERPEALDRLLAALSDMPKRPLTLGFLRDAGEEDAFFEQGGNILRIWEWDTAPGRIAGHVDRGRPVWITTGEGTTNRKVGDFDAGELLRMAGEGATGFLVNDPRLAREAFVEGQ